MLINKIKLDGAFKKSSWEGQTTLAIHSSPSACLKHRIDTVGGYITESKLPLLIALVTGEARAQPAT